MALVIVQPLNRIRNAVKSWILNLPFFFFLGVNHLKCPGCGNPRAKKTGNKQVSEGAVKLVLEEVECPKRGGCGKTFLVPKKVAAHFSHF